MSKVLRPDRFLQLMLRVLFFCVRYVFRFLRFFIKPLSRVHPRIHHFGVDIKEAIRKLLSPPQGYQSIGGKNEIRHIAIDDKSQSTTFIPNWLIEEMRAIHDIEPQVFPGEAIRKKPPLQRQHTSNIAKAYIEICEQYGENVSHILLVPWIERGGADLVVMNYIQAIIEHSQTNTVAVFTTINADSPWADKLPEKVRLIEFGKMFGYLSEDEQEKLLTRVLLQKMPPVIHNINSELGYKIFSKYGKALSQASALYATIFCVDQNVEGKYLGYAFSYIPKCIDYLRALAVDNKAFIDRLIEMFAFDRDKIYLHYQPVKNLPGKVHKTKKYDDEHLNILWAGRLDRQKCPDILIRIAEAVKEYPFKINVYGISVLNKETVGFLTLFGGEQCEALVTDKFYLSVNIGKGAMKIIKKADGYHMIPIGKRQKVTINGDSIKEECVIHNGDRIEIGPMKMQFLVKNMLIEKFKDQENIEYHGIFNKLESLPIDEFDVFLYTSRWDGMPTILLDAMMLRLPIIASNVGGVCELIEHEKTGYLVDPYDDVDAYVNCLLKINHDVEMLEPVVDRAHDLVKKRHSWQRFMDNVKKFPGYLGDEME
jgi:glycosyltransferase involved in cell wall biosynthesis